MKLVIVEGNISAGKSTLCRALAKELGFALFLEPVVTNPYLEMYYADPVAYGLMMQLWLLRQRFIMYARALRALEFEGAQGVVLDRSLMSDVVFADKNLADGNITSEGYAVYQALRAHLLNLVPLPDAVVYLDATAEVCHERIHGVRKRDCESGIPLAYLQGLDECYGAFLQDMASKGTHVATFDWRDFATAPTPEAVAAAVLAGPDRQTAPGDTDTDRLTHSSLKPAAPPVKSSSPSTKTLPFLNLPSLVASDASVLAALEPLQLPTACRRAFEGLAPPDMADACESLHREVARSEAEERHGVDEGEATETAGATETAEGNATEACTTAAAAVIIEVTLPETESNGQELSSLGTPVGSPVKGSGKNYGDVGSPKTVLDLTGSVEDTAAVSVTAR